MFCMPLRPFVPRASIMIEGVDGVALPPQEALPIAPIATPGVLRHANAVSLRGDVGGGRRCRHRVEGVLHIMMPHVVV